MTIRQFCPAAVMIVFFLLARQMPGQAPGAGLSIENYRLVSEERFTRTQWFRTYQADLVNTGLPQTAVTATVTTLVSTAQVVPGRGVLHFAPVPSNSRVSGSDTFTLLIDDSVRFDFAALAWSFLNPVANAGPNQTVQIGGTVSLNGGASTNPSASGTLGYHWALESVPPGSRAKLSSADSVIASFIVDAQGTYSLSLTVSNGSSSDRALVSVSTANSPPVANAGPNQSAPLGATVTLTGASSSDVDGDSLTYSWSFVSRPPGSTAELSNLRSVAPSFVADRAGAYLVQLVVNDGQGNSTPAIVNIAVAAVNTPPVANAGRYQSVDAGALVQLDGAGSTDVDGDPLTYRWSLITLPAGSSAALRNPTAVKPTFTVDVAGLYVAQLIVNDGKVDSAPSTVSIATNAAQPPIAVAGPNQTVRHGAPVMLSGSAIDPQQLPVTFIWSLIARPAGSLAVLSAINIPNPVFMADKPGTYVAQLVVSNGTLTSLPATVAITTTNTAPVANAGASRSVPIGVVVSLDGSGSSDADHDPVTYSWSLLSRPPGSAAALQEATTASPAFFADVAGSYVAQLIVSDGYTNSNPATVTITAGSMGITLSPKPMNLAGSQATLTISVSSPAPAGGINFSLTSSNLAVAGVPSAAFLNEGMSTVGVRVIRMGTGSAVIHVLAPGFPEATAIVTVPPPGSIALSGPTTVSLNQTGPLTVSLSEPAPAPGVTVQLASSDPGKVALSPPTLFIPAGSTAPSAPPEWNAVNVGAASLTASAPGYAVSAPVVVNVGAAVTWVTLGATIVGIGNQTSLTLQLSTHAPLDPASDNPWSTGLPVNLTSSNPNVATIQATGIFIWDGSSAPGIAIPVTAVGPGTTVIHASGVNVPDVTTTVTVVAR